MGGKKSIACKVMNCQYNLLPTLAYNLHKLAGALYNVFINPTELV
jgi:hypothetical protein